MNMFLTKALSKMINPQKKTTLDHCKRTPVSRSVRCTWNMRHWG